MQVSRFLSELEAAAGIAAEGGADSGSAVAKLLRAVAGVRDQVNRFSAERSGLQARARLQGAHGSSECHPCSRTRSRAWLAQASARCTADRFLATTFTSVLEIGRCRLTPKYVQTTAATG